MKKFSLIILNLIVLFLSADGQPQIASPKIVNYSIEQHKGGIQNWCIAQDKNGILYFGNNEGLITFNGRFWNLHQLPNLTVIRAIRIDSKGRIFVGGQDEIGYFFPDNNGVLRYHSLLSLLPVGERKFADIWNIEILGDEVFFRSIAKIIHYKDNTIKIYKPKLGWEFLGEANRQLYASEKGGTLMTYNKGIWKPLINDPALDRSAITSILAYSKDTLLISTLKDGLFLFHDSRISRKVTSIDLTLQSDRVNCITRVNNDWFAVGTMSEGLFIINKNGKQVQQYSYKQGLQKNNIRGALIDHNRNLWLALDEGIDFIAINSAVKYIYPDKSQQVTAYAINVFKNQLFIGTSNGLYSSPIEPAMSDISLSKGNFSEVKSAKGQVWNLQEVNDQLLMGHDEGLFNIKDNTAVKIYSSPGTWVFQPMSDVYPADYILAGTYTGLRYIKYSEGKITDQGHAGSLYESLRFIIYDSNNSIVWASHPNRGIYKFELSPQTRKILKTTLYTAKDGLPSSLYNYVYRVKNRIVVAAEDGVYEYNAVSDKFMPSALLTPALKGISVQYLKEDNEGNVWFVTNKKVGVVDFSDRKDRFNIIYLPELNGKVVGGFECIYPFNNENIFIGGNKGVFHVNYRKYRQNLTLPDILLNMVKSSGKADSVIFGGYFLNNAEISAIQDPKNIIGLPHNQNSVHFEYTSTLYDQQNSIEFSYQLEGFDNHWSAWSGKPEKDYTNLSPGTYVFKVRSRNNLGNESSVLSYRFYVLPAWYQSLPAWLLYILLLVGVIYRAFKWQKKKHIRAREHLTYLHQLELDRSEKEIVRLKNEQLEADVNYKNKELAGMTMDLLQRGEVLAKVKEVISALVKKHDATIENSPGFRQLIRLIREVERSDEDWAQFTMHFNHVNAGFFAALKEKYPDLTSYELKLCAYLKMNLSSKEIAQLMNITIKAVEVGRYRLRKKLQLPSETNLYGFLMQLSVNR